MEYWVEKQVLDFRKTGLQLQFYVSLLISDKLFSMSQSDHFRAKISTSSKG